MTRKRNSDNDSGISAGASAASRRKPASRTRAKRVVSPEAPVTSAAEPEIALSEPEITVSEAVPVVSVPVPPPTREEIAQLAFLYWEQRGGQGGSPEEDWLRAERELQMRVAATA